MARVPGSERFSKFSTQATEEPLSHPRITEITDEEDDDDNAGKQLVIKRS